MTHNYFCIVLYYNLNNDNIIDCAYLLKGIVKYTVSHDV